MTSAARFLTTFFKPLTSWRLSEDVSVSVGFYMWGDTSQIVIRQALDNKYMYNATEQLLVYLLRTLRSRGEHIPPVQKKRPKALDFQCCIRVHASYFDLHVYLTCNSNFNLNLFYACIGWYYKAEQQSHSQCMKSRAHKIQQKNDLCKVKLF